jgi:putative spermidine/putrescine transport system substrate-binding protein
MKSSLNQLQSKRRNAVKAVVAAVSIAFVGAGAAYAQAPKSPVTINVVDVAGNLALTQDAFELYARKNPQMVSKFVFTKAPAPELPGKLKAMQGAGRSGHRHRADRAPTCSPPASSRDCW